MIDLLKLDTIAYFPLQVRNYQQDAMTALAVPSRNSRVRTVTSKLAHSVFFYVLYRHVLLALYRHTRARGIGGSLNEVVDHAKQVNGQESNCNVNVSTNSFGMTNAARCGTTP